MKLYFTPPSILTLVTWVPQSRQAFGHSAHRLAIGPPALAKPNPTVCSLACRWQLRSARAFLNEFTFLSTFWVLFLFEYVSIESNPLLVSKALCQQLQVVLNISSSKKIMLNLIFVLQNEICCNGPPPPTHFLMKKRERKNYFFIELIFLSKTTFLKSFFE